VTAKPLDMPAAPRAEAPSKPSKKLRTDKAGHKLHLPEAVFKRLQLEAIQRGERLSTVAADILDRHLPKLSIRRD